MNVRTVVRLDDFIWVSEDLWRDATFACRHDKTGWRRLPPAAEDKLANVISDLMPEYDGENCVLVPPVEVRWYAEEEQ